MTKVGLWRLALLLVACSRPPEGDGARELVSGAGLHSFAVAADQRTAWWIEGRFPERTRLARLDLETGAVERRRHKGWTLVSLEARNGGGVVARARKLSEASRDPGAESGLAIAPDGALEAVRALPSVPPRSGPEVWTLRVRESDGEVVIEKPDAVIRSPGGVDSLLSASGSLYLVVRSSLALVTSAGPGPRRLVKIDETSGRREWDAQWLARPTRLLARTASGRLLVSVEDADGGALWELRDDPAAIARAAGTARVSPWGRRLRLWGLYLARLAAAGGFAALLLLMVRAGRG